MRCLEFMKITEILRLKEMNLFTYRDIAQSVGCSKTTVGDILSRCKACGLTYEDARSMTRGRINELVYPESFGPKQVKDEPDWEAIHARLQSSVNGILFSIYGKVLAGYSCPKEADIIKVQSIMNCWEKVMNIGICRTAISYLSVRLTHLEWGLAGIPSGNDVRKNRNCFCRVEH